MTPAERPGWCPDCGTTPCQHPPAGVDLLAVLVIVALAAGVGLLLGYLLAAWAVAP